MRLPGRFNFHHRPRCTRWRQAHGLCLLRRHGQREGSAHLYDDFHHLSEPLRRSQDYAGGIRVQHAPHRTTNVVHGRLRSHRRRRFLQVHQVGEDGRFLTESLENNSNTAAKKMLNNSGDSTHPCRSPCSTSNQSEQTPSSGCTQALILLWNCWMTAMICGGTPMRVSTCHSRVRSTVSYAFWRSMKHMKRDTPAFRPISCGLRTTNIMPVVE